MAAALGMMILHTFVGAGLAIWAAALSRTLLKEGSATDFKGWMIPWAVKGVIAPILLWSAMNIGLSWTFPAFMPQIQAAQNAGVPWLPAFVRAWGNGFLVVTSTWAAATLAWTLYRMSGRLTGEAMKDFKGLCCTAGVAMMLVSVGILALWGWPAIGLAAFALLAPIAGSAPGMLFKRPTPPMYGRAIAKMKMGKYTEAEWEIIKQLEKCEDDFDGWMMMATLYAQEFRDLAEAEQTVLDICDQPRVTPSQMAVALHKLADWYLELKGDPDGARRSLQLICDRAPGTHLARMALLRMSQVGMTPADVAEQQAPRPIPLPVLGDAFDEGEQTAKNGQNREEAIRVAKDCVERLKLDPNNNPVRERFARVLAEELGAPDQAIEQLELMVEMISEPDTKRAEWLGLIAACHLKHRKDTAAGRAVLERILAEFPRTPQALAARRRLQLLDREAAQAQP